MKNETTALKLSNEHPKNEDDLGKNTMNSLRDLLGYSYYTSRTVFEYEGDEFVFVNDGLIGRIRIYVNGHEVISQWPIVSDWYSNTSFSYAGKTLRIKSQITNLVTSAQKITFYADGTEVAVKRDPRLAALTAKQMIHFVGGLFATGLAAGFLLSMFL